MFLIKEIFDPLKLERSQELVTIVGAGGKTTCMFTLAKELKSLGKRVLITTTTAIYKPESKDYDRLFIGGLQDFKEEIGKSHLSQNSGEIVVWGGKIQGVPPEDIEKIQGVSPEDIEKIHKREDFSWILVEGDGAKRKSIKAPKDKEPVIPKTTTLLIGVIGMEVLGKPIEESRVHRIKQFTEITDTKIGDRINESVLQKLIFHDKGLFKGKPPGAKKMLLLNQCEATEIRHRALAFAEGITMAYVVTSLWQQEVYGARKNIYDTP